MCVVSAIGDNWQQSFPEKFPNWEETVRYWPTVQPPNTVVLSSELEGFRKEIEAIRQDILELKKLLKVAIDYDAKTGQPHCENEDKIALIRKVADAVGVDLSDLKLED